MSEEQSTHRITLDYTGDDDGAIDFARELFEAFGARAAVERKSNTRMDWEWFFTSGGNREETLWQTRTSGSNESG